MAETAPWTLKSLWIAHFLLSSWAFFSGFIPVDTYFFTQAGVLAFGLWAIASLQSVDAILMFMISTVLSIATDITVLVLYIPRGYDKFEKLNPYLPNDVVNEFRFALAAAIVNVILKPVTVVTAYSIYVYRSTGSEFDFGARFGGCLQSVSSGNNRNDNLYQGNQNQGFGNQGYGTHQTIDGQNTEYQGQHQRPPNNGNQGRYQGPQNVGNQGQYQGPPNNGNQGQYQGQPSNVNQGQYQGPPNNGNQGQYQGQPSNVNQGQYQGPQNTRNQGQYQGQPNNVNQGQYQGPQNTGNQDQSQGPSNNGNQEPQNTGNQDQYQGSPNTGNQGPYQGPQNNGNQGQYQGPQQTEIKAGNYSI